MRWAQGTVAIEIEISLRRVRDNQNVLLKTYRADTPAASDSLDAAVEAFPRGLDSIYAALLADISLVPRDMPARR